MTAGSTSIAVHNMFTFTSAEDRTHPIQWDGQALSCPTITMTDIAGKLIYQNALHLPAVSHAIFDVGGILPPGIYCICIRAGSYKQVSRAVVR